MFRGRPIDLPSKIKLSPYMETPVVKNGAQTPVSNVNDRQNKEKLSSPVSVYDEGDYLVKDPRHIYSFGQQSTSSRISDLQAAANVTIPDVAVLPKLLKSHNVSYKDGDNASTWYLRFNNFCLMIGIYLTPPSAMEKNSEMGKEWDSQSLPYVFYSRFNKMERVLSHILFSPDFFPKSMSDDLQLNPNPYNFLCLFMTLKSHAVPELSDQVIKRPSMMKSSHTLSQYALLWVNYFLDEMNVNGVKYSKYRQYCYCKPNIPSFINSWRWNLPCFMTKLITFRYLGIEELTFYDLEHGPYSWHQYGRY
jgi:hypothetical protein